MSLKNLLVPTDFSDQALPILQYALSLANNSGATLHVLHSYYIPINTIEADYVADQALWLEQARLRALEEMKLLEEQHLKSSGLAYECHVHPGPSMEDINHTIREKGIELVVMGTHKTHDFEAFFGELYTYAIRHAKAPVLLIPEGTTFSPPSRVIFATDLKPIDNWAPVENLHRLLQIFKPQLTLLHAYKNGETMNPKKQAELSRLQQQFSDLNPQIIAKESSNAEESIVDYAREQDAQWLVAISHHYGLLDSLFHSSHTKKLARLTEIPLLVSHE